MPKAYDDLYMDKSKSRQCIQHNRSKTVILELDKVDIFWKKTSPLSITPANSWGKGVLPSPRTQQPSENLNEFHDSFSPAEDQHTRGPSVSERDHAVCVIYSKRPRADRDHMVNGKLLP